MWPEADGITNTDREHLSRAERAAETVRSELLSEVGTGSDAAVDLPERIEVAARIRRVDPLLSPAFVSVAVESVLAHAGGVGRLAPLLDDDQVSEVMVNGDGAVWVERAGQLSRTATTLSPDETLSVAERVLSPLGLRVDRACPVTDARLPDGSRVNVVVPPVAVDGPCLTIRRFRLQPVPVGALCSSSAQEILETAVRSRRNVLVSGGTSAGKTTLLNALAERIDPVERIVTIEETAELQLPREHVVRLEARPPTADGVGEMSLGELVRAALRMRPDRIVVGEVRGGEALAMLQAMNTGHEGSMSTIHANSPPDALRRLETMVLAASPGLPHAAVREHIRSAVDLVVQMARRAGQRRAVMRVDEVDRQAPLEAPVSTLILDRQLPQEDVR